MKMDIKAMWCFSSRTNTMNLPMGLANDSNMRWLRSSVTRCWSVIDQKQISDITIQLNVLFVEMALLALFIEAPSIKPENAPNSNEFDRLQSST